MAVGSGGGGERSLEQTPTWAVVVVCSGFVIISILIEKLKYSLCEKDMAVGSGGGERSLEQTPTWAVVVVCSVL
jgi:hypothetical protein